MLYPNLAGAMGKYDVSQHDLAEHLGVVDSAVSYMLNDKKEPMSVKNARSIKNKFFPNLSFEYLFSLEPTEVEK